MKSFDSKTLEEIEKQRDNLKKLIDEEQKKQEKVLKANENQIQMKVDRANRFIKGEIYLWDFKEVKKRRRILYGGNLKNIFLRSFS